MAGGSAVGAIVSSEDTRASRSGTPKRALIITTIGRTIETFLRPHIAHLSQLGWRLAVATNNRDAVLNGIGSQVIDIPFSRSVIRVLSHLRAFYAIRRQLRRNSADLIYVHTAIASAVVRFAVSSLPRRCRPKVVYFVHGFHFLGRGERNAAGWLWYAIERLLSRWTDAIVVINKDDFDSVRKWPIARRGDVHLVQGVGFEPTHYSVRQNGGPPKGNPTAGGAPRLLSISEVTSNKRHALLLSAVARTNARLVLVGRGTDSTRMRALVDRFGLSGRVDCVGYVKDVRPFIADADLTVLVSRREGLPRSLMESLAMGTPIVVTHTRGSRDLAAAVGCPIANAATPKAIAEAIRRGLADSRVRSEIRAQFLAAWSGGTTESVVSRVGGILEAVSHRR